MISEEKLLARVKDFASHAHGSQQRKYTSDPYIVHPVRVMQLLKQYTHDTPVLAAALLHDVLEDTPVTKKQVHTFLCGEMSTRQAAETMRLVEELTDRYTKEAYPQFNRRKRKAMELDRMAKTSAAAQTIKYADIMDNCMEIVEHDPSFAKVFLSECKALLQKMTNGNAALYRKTKELVESKISSLKRG